MGDLFKNSYYWLDLLVGFGSPILLLVLIRVKLVDKLNWKIFCLGAFIGAFWEIPMFLLSKYSTIPVVAWIRPFPVNFSFYMVSHTLWDGALFLLGVWFIKMICAPPVLMRFRWQELAVLLAWGQISAFMVEFSAVSNDAWSFIGTYWFNPPLIWIGDHSVTIMMQLIWLVVTVPFYLVVLRMKRDQTAIRA